MRGPIYLEKTEVDCGENDAKGQNGLKRQVKTMISPNE